MPLQLGRCAFTAACSFPGPRYRVRGTQQLICAVHARTFVLACESPTPAVGEASALRLFANEKAGGRGPTVKNG